MNYEKIYTNIFNKYKNYNSNTSVSYQVAKSFLDLKIKECNSIADIGTGKGNLINLIKQDKKYFNLKINCYDLDLFFNIKKYKNLTFKKINLVDKNSLNVIEKVDFLFCLDVLEHIEENYIDSILEKLSQKSKYTFFTIANHSDVFDGVELHLIQKDVEYWNKLIKKYYSKIINVQSYYNNRLFSFYLEN